MSFTLTGPDIEIINFGQGGVAFCTRLTLGPAGPPDPNSIVVYAPAPNNYSNNFTIENVAGGAAGGFGLDPASIFELDGGGVVVAAVSVPQPISANGGSVGLLVINTGFTIFQTLGFNFGTGVNGGFQDFMGTPIGPQDKPYPTVWPYKLQIEVAEDGTAVYYDNNGQAPTALPSAGSFVGNDLLLGSFGSAPLTAAGKIDITLNGGYAAMPLPLDDPAAETWCNLLAPPLVPLYEFIEVTPPSSNVVKSNANRTLTVTHDNVNDGDFQEAAGWFPTVPPSVEQPDGNSWEFEIDSNTNDALDGFLVFLISSADNPSNAQGVLVAQDFDKNLITMSVANLFTRSIGAGDLIILQILDNGTGPSPSDASNVRFIFVPNGGTPVIFDDFKYAGGFKDFSVSVSNQSVPKPAPSVLALTFNSEEPDLSFNQYPVGSKDYAGVAYTGAVTAAHVRNSLWNDNPYNGSHQLAGNVISLDGTRKILTCSTIANAISEGWSVGSAMIDEADSNIIALVWEVTTADSLGEAPLCQVLGMGDGGLSYIRVREQAGDIVALVKTSVGGASSTLLKGTASFNNGDLVVMKISPLSTSVTISYHDGATWNRNVGYPLGLNFDGAGGEAPAAWLPSGGCNNMAAGESMTLTNMNLNTDMPALAKTEIGVGSFDVLGNAIV